jgi:hypothetical protein
VRAHCGAFAVFGAAFGRPCAALRGTSRRCSAGLFARLPALPATDFDSAAGCGEEEEEEESRRVLSTFAASSGDLVQAASSDVKKRSRMCMPPLSHRPRRLLLPR